MGRRNRLKRLLELTGEGKRTLVLTHDNPDPDALASAAALMTLLETRASSPVDLAFGGFVGRAENRALLRYLGLRWLRPEELIYDDYARIALVDTQLEAGNNSLPRGTHVHIVLDHHPLRPATRAVPFRDIRSKTGAASTILCQYLQDAGLDPDQHLATALFYGIQSETQDLGREATRHDIRASTWLYPRSDKRWLSRIEHSRVPSEYFRALEQVITQARIYDPGVILSHLDLLEYPDMVAEMADLILRLEGMQWAMVMGRFDNTLFLSLRTTRMNVSAGQLIQEMIGDQGSAGGHDLIAGGQVPLQDRDPDTIQDLREGLIHRFLTEVGADPTSVRPLVDSRTEQKVTATPS